MVENPSVFGVSMFCVNSCFLTHIFISWDAFLMAPAPQEAPKLLLLSLLHQSVCNSTADKAKLLLESCDLMILEEET